ncbi:MAG: Hsp20/alpha crystallin family protein [Anaerolineales bacterium]|jgi:HSP20 family protein
MADYLSNWDPFRELWNMRRMMNRFVDEAFDRQVTGWAPEEWGLALDVSEKEDQFVVKASIPGINPDDLDITFNNDVLTIKGEVQSEEESENERYHLRERRYGHFSRSITLPTKVKADKISANYDAGVLTLTLPKAEEAKPKRIAIKAGKTGKMIEGKVRNLTNNKN